MVITRSGSPEKRSFLQQIHDTNVALASESINSMDSTDAHNNNNAQTPENLEALTKLEEAKREASKQKTKELQAEKELQKEQNEAKRLELELLKEARAQNNNASSSNVTHDEEVDEEVPKSVFEETSDQNQNFMVATEQKTTNSSAIWYEGLM